MIYEATFLVNNSEILKKYIEKFIIKYIKNKYENLDIINNDNYGSKEIYFQSIFENELYFKDDLYIDFNVSKIDTYYQLKIIFKFCNANTKYNLNIINKIKININQYFLTKIRNLESVEDLEVFDN